MNTFKVRGFMCGIALMCSLWGCASAASKNEQRRFSQPADIVKLICIDRVADYNTFTNGKWNLDEYEAYFSTNLQAEMGSYISQHDSFFGKYKKYCLNITKLGAYLMLSQGDPVTQCHEPPLQPQMQQIQRNQAACDYKVSYQVYGNDRLRHERHVTVHLVIVKERWIISDVEYGEPVYIFGDRSAKPIQTLSEMLSVMTRELHDSATWAAQHSKELVPNGEIHVGRGPFDRP